MKMHRNAPIFVPRLLRNDQKEHCVNACTELENLASGNEIFLSRVITGDGKLDCEWSDKAVFPNGKAPNHHESKNAKWKATMFLCDGYWTQEIFSIYKIVNFIYCCNVLLLREDIRRKLYVRIFEKPKI